MSISVGNASSAAEGSADEQKCVVARFASRGEAEAFLLGGIEQLMRGCGLDTRHLGGIKSADRSQ